MPLSPIAELLLRPIFEFVVAGVWYLTGVVVVQVFTFGAYGVEDLGKPPRRRTRKQRAPESLPPRTVSGEVAMFIGMVTWVAIVAAAYFYWRAST